MLKKLSILASLPLMIIAPAWAENQGHEITSPSRPATQIESDAVNARNSDHQSNWNARPVDNGLPGTYLLTTNDPYFSGATGLTQLYLVNKGKIILHDLGLGLSVSDHKTKGINDIIDNTETQPTIYKWNGKAYEYEYNGKVYSATR